MVTPKCVLIVELEEDDPRNEISYRDCVFVTLMLLPTMLAQAAPQETLYSYRVLPSRCRVLKVLWKPSLARREQS